MKRKSSSQFPKGGARAHDDVKSVVPVDHQQQEPAPSNSVQLGITILVWYAAAAVAAIETKAAVQPARHMSAVAGLGAVAFVCALQMSALAILSALLLRWRGVPTSSIALHCIAPLPKLSWQLNRQPWVHGIGSFASNAAVVFADATVVQALKATEPVFAVLFSSDPKERSARKVLTSLLVVVAGAACGGFTMGSKLFTVAGSLGIALSMLSNVAFTRRNADTKRLEAANPSLDGLVLLMFSSLYSGIGCFLVAGVLGALHPVVFAFAKTPVVYRAIASSSLCFALYQLASGMVLDGVSPVTHALINVGKRVFIVGAAAAVLGTPLPPSAAAAFGLLVAGLCLHNDSLARALRSSLGFGPADEKRV